jgi:folylpolyglutamate synthase/dihydropteroate synthase
VIATAWLHRTRCDVTDWLCATAEPIAAERARVTTLRPLLVLDERMLADIGMTREEIEFALHRSRAARDLRARRNARFLEHFPKRPVPDLIRDGQRFSAENVIKHKSLERFQIH